MLEIKTHKKGSFTVLFHKTNTFTEALGYELLTKLSTHLKEHAKITINLNGIDKMEANGYKHLSKINSMAQENNCEISFINIHDDISEITDSFTLTSEG